MTIEIRFLIKFLKGTEANEDEKSKIRQRIQETFIRHPFHKDPTGISSLNVWLKVGFEHTTDINHDLFPIVRLYLCRNDICYTGGVMDLDEDKLIKVLSHEFGHVIDARFSDTFSYHDNGYKSQPYKKIYNLLWNSYIDGRLNDLAPYEINDRIEEARHIGIKSDLVRKAWNKEFTTHKELLSKAEEAYKESTEKRR